MDRAAPPLVLGVVATTYGLLPERLDLTHVFAAYGTGSLVGEAIAARFAQLDPAVSARRWGGWSMAFVGAFWLVGLLSGLL